MNELGKYISKIRQERNLTQKELADKMHLHVTTISKWENGNSIPNLNYLEDLAKALDITTAELFACRKANTSDEHPSETDNCTTVETETKSKSLEEENTTPIAEPKTTNNKKRKILIGISIALLIIAAVAGIFFYGKDSDKLRYEIVDEFLSENTDYFGFDDVYYIVVEYKGTITDDFLQSYQHEIRKEYTEKFQEADLLRVFFVTNYVDKQSLSSAIYELTLLPLPE